MCSDGLGQKHLKVDLRLPYQSLWTLGCMHLWKAMRAYMILVISDDKAVGVPCGKFIIWCSCLSLQMGP